MKLFYSSIIFSISYLTFPNPIWTLLVNLVLYLEISYIHFCLNNFHLEIGFLVLSFSLILIEILTYIVGVKDLPYMPWIAYKSP